MEPLDLGEVNGAARRETAPLPPVRARRRWATSIAVLLVGALVGSYAWLARSDMLGTNQVDLVVTDVIHDAPHSDGALTSVVAYVRNIGSDAVTITDANVPGQPSTDDRESDGVTVPAGEQAAVGVSGELNCGSGLPDVIEADVRTPSGETSAELAVPATVVGHVVRCGSRAPGEVWVENLGSSPGAPVEISEISDSGVVMTIPLSIRSWSVDDVEILDVAVSDSPGLAAELSGLAGRHETRTVAELRVDWTVTDCATAFHVEPVDITVTFADHPPTTLRAPESVWRTLERLPDLVCES